MALMSPAEQALHDERMRRWRAYPITEYEVGKLEAAGYKARLHETPDERFYVVDEPNDDYQLIQALRLLGLYDEF